MHDNDSKPLLGWEDEVVVVVAVAVVGAAARIVTASGSSFLATTLLTHFCEPRGPLLSS